MDNRVDLNQEFASITDESFLKDLSQVAQKKSDEKARAARIEQRKKSSKIKTVIIACATVLLIVIAYFAVFNSNNVSSVASDTNVPARVAPRATSSSQPSQQVSSRRSRTNSDATLDQGSSSRRSDSRARTVGGQVYDQPRDTGM